MFDPLKYLTNAGYDPDAAQAALLATNNNVSAAAEILNEQIRKRSEDESLSRAVAESLKPQNAMDFTSEDVQLNQAIEMSMKDQGFDVEGGDPEQRMRKEGVPVGLKNIGNTCYFNSLLQIYFMIPSFMKRIMEYKYEEKAKDTAASAKKESAKKEETKSKGSSKPEKKEQEKENRRKASVELLLNLQKLFAYLICSNRKYVEPTAVLKALVDDYGNQIAIGDQKDAGEFNIMFLSQINEALQDEESKEEAKTSAKPSPEAADKDLPLTPSRSMYVASDSPRKSPGLSRSLTLGIPEMLSTLQRKLDDTFIYENFFGEFQIVSKAREKDGNLVELSAVSPFGQIMINATEKDVYEGWDTNYFNEIEDFQTPSGYVTKAEQEYWITRLPSVLLLQMQRVSFDKEKKCISKITNPVKFDKVIHLDRFMLANKEASSVIRAEVREHKKKIRALEQALAAYRTFGNSKLNIQSVLSTTRDFLKNQDTSMVVDEPEKGVKLFSPTRIGDLGHGAEGMSKAVELLGSFEAKVKEQVTAMEAQLSDYQNRVAHSYDHMRDNAYQLHSIIIHSGQADSGHYYAYIHDSEQDKWRKYNDRQVTEVPEAEVFKTSTGEENSTVSAYCLVYISKGNDMRVDSSNTLMRQFSLSETKLAVPKPVSSGSEKIIDYYTSLLPGKLKQEVLEDNKKLDNEIGEHKAGQLVKRVQQVYSDRHEVLMQLKDQKPFEKIFHTFNFVCYLEANKSPLARWHLLDTTLQENFDSIGLDLLEKDHPVYLKLKNNFMKVCKNCPATLDLSESQMHTLNVMKSAFEKLYVDRLCFKYVVNKLVAKDWLTAYSGICYYMTNAVYALKENKLKMLDITRLLVLRLCSCADEYIMNKNIPAAINLTRIVSQLCVFLLDKDDPHTKYSIKLLAYIYDGLGDVIPSEQQKEVGEYLQDIAKNNTKTRNVLPKNPPEELKVQLEQVKNDPISIFGWKEPWKDSPKDEINELLQPFLVGNRHWYDIHSKIYANKVQYTSEEIYQAEKSIGIDFKKCLGQTESNPPHNQPRYSIADQ